MSEERAEYKTSEPKEVSKPKKSPKKFKGLVVSSFKIDGKSYKKGGEYATTDEHRFDKLIRINKINKK